MKKTVSLVLVVLGILWAAVFLGIHLMCKEGINGISLVVPKCRVVELTDMAPSKDRYRVEILTATGYEPELLIDFGLSKEQAVEYCDSVNHGSKNQKVIYP